MNRIIREAEEFFSSLGFVLPPFARWTPEEWEERGRGFDHIRERGLGWDITDFGSGEFEKTGLVLFTLRNGDPEKPSEKPYAEKIMVVADGQVTPWHYHATKVEDIINRGGGKLVMDLANSTPDGKLADTSVRVMVDGEARKLPPRGRLVLGPGMSVTLTQKLYHVFWGEGRVMVGEVSSVNDDATDNFFLEPVGRFPAIEEDEPPCRLLCTEYPPVAGRYEQR